MFWASSCPSSGATTTAVAASGLPSELDGSSADGRGLADHDQQHCYHQAPTVNERLLLQLLYLLMMGMRMPETCWAVSKRQVINLRSCCILLVDSVESTMMHGQCLVVGYWLVISAKYVLELWWTKWYCDWRPWSTVVSHRDLSTHYCWLIVLH
jgi:hypothetical protein